MTQPKTGPNTTGQTVPLHNASLAIDGLPKAEDLIAGVLDDREFAEQISAALVKNPELILEVREKLLSHEDSSVALAALRGIKPWNQDVAIVESVKLAMKPLTSPEAFPILHSLSPDAAAKTLTELRNSEEPVLQELGAHIGQAYLEAV